MDTVKLEQMRVRRRVSHPVVQQHDLAVEPVLEQGAEREFTCTAEAVDRQTWHAMSFQYRQSCRNQQDGRRQAEAIASIAC